MNQLDQILTDIAREHLDIPTLGTRNSDSLDFHDVSVCGVKNALSHAYQAGVNASVREPPPHREATDKQRHVPYAWPVPGVAERLPHQR